MYKTITPSLVRDSWLETVQRIKAMENLMWVSTGFAHSEGLPRHITIADTLTFTERNRLFIYGSVYRGKTAKPMLESVTTLGVHYPSSKQNRYTIAVELNGQIVSGKKLPKNKFYLVAPDYGCVFQHEYQSSYASIKLDNDTGEIVASDTGRNNWTKLKLISYEEV